MARNLLPVHLALLLSAAPAVLAKDAAQEKVSKGSDEIFISKLGASEKLPADYKAGETSYFLHVPDDYNPQRAYPLILAISPGDDGRGMYGPFQKAAEAHPLFFCCPHQAGNPVTLLHSGALEQPVIRPGDDPVTRTVERRHRLGADECGFVGRIHRQIRSCFRCEHKNRRADEIIRVSIIWLQTFPSSRIFCVARMDQHPIRVAT